MKKMSKKKLIFSFMIILVVAISAYLLVLNKLCSNTTLELSTDSTINPQNNMNFLCSEKNITIKNNSTSEITITELAGTTVTKEVSSVPIQPGSEYENTVFNSDTMTYSIHFANPDDDKMNMAVVSISNRYYFFILS